MIVGLENAFIHEAGSQEYLKSCSGLSPDKIIETIKNEFNKG